MAPQTPLEYAAWLLGFAAVGGLTLAIIRFSGKPFPPSWLVLGHGLLAGVGLGCLLYAAFTTGVPQFAKVAIALFVLAAAGGLYMNRTFHRKGQALPMAFVLGHGATALAGVVMLWLAVRPV